MDMKKRATLMRAELKRVKAAHPTMSHPKGFGMASKNVAKKMRKTGGTKKRKSKKAKK